MPRWMKSPGGSGLGMVEVSGFVGPVFAPYVSDTDRTAVWPAGTPFPAEIRNGEVRFDFETRGPWSVLVKLQGVAIEKTEGGVKVWGVRSLNKPRESGYNHEGVVSVGGKSLRAFTSSQLFLVSGKLVDVGILYVVRKKAGLAGVEDEPEVEEGDITTEDHTRWYQYGKLYFTGDEKGLLKKMNKDKFWPNVWFVSDHGNAHLVTL